MSIPIFFMPKFQLAAKAIKTVKIRRSNRKEISENKVSLSYSEAVIINGDYMFLREEGIQAIDALFSCGFYSPDQHNEVKTLFNKYMKEYKGDND